MVDWRARGCRAEERRRRDLLPVMAGLVPAIHVFLGQLQAKAMDGRDKPGMTTHQETELLTCFFEH
jgi:hypothetical protein